MAEVYLAYDISRSSYLTLKSLHDDLADDVVFLRRFRREAQTLSKLQHPNIVCFYGIEEEKDNVFLLLDYINGPTLRKVIKTKGRPFSPQEVLEVLTPLYSALGYAHNNDLVHCDIKPANIMLDKLGKIYLTDFGIARLAESTATSTMAGAGTPAYMSPEQILGREPTPQTDIYALSIVLYEMLTGGERPFTGENAKSTGSTAEKVSWEQLHFPPPSPRLHNPSLSPALENIVLKCLSKYQEEPYSSTADLLSAFQSAVQPSRPIVAAFPTPSQPSPVIQPMKAMPTSSPLLSHRNRKNAWWIGLAGLVLVLDIGSVFAFTPPFLTLHRSTATPFPVLTYPSPYTPSATDPLIALPSFTLSPSSYPTDTFTPVIPLFTVNSNGYCRQGPGMIYPKITLLNSGASVPVIGKTPKNWEDWWLVQTDSGDCWISASLGSLNSDPSILLVADFPPTPVPTTVAILTETQPPSRDCMVTLSVSVNGEATEVVTDPAGIHCWSTPPYSTCSARFPCNSSVFLSIDWAGIGVEIIGDNCDQLINLSTKDVSCTINNIPWPSTTEPPP